MRSSCSLHAGQIEHPVGRVDAGDEDRARLAGLGVLPQRQAEVDRAHRFDTGEAQRLQQAAAREALRLRDEVELRADQERLAGERLVQARRTVEQRLAEAELHEDQDDGECDAGNGDEQPQLLAHELEPRQRDREHHGRAGLALMSQEKFTAETRRRGEMRNASCNGLDPIKNFGLRFASR